MSLQIKEYYKGKNVFLSGCTGFLGKVVLEKIFRSCPDVNKIYVMVRAKRGKKPIMERIQSEILTSFCFSTIPNIKALAESKIIPIAGDLIVDGLGLSPQDRLMIIENCHVMINCAASVNFDDPLQDALRINYFGCLNMLELAKECKRIEVFTHVSTCYVNCNRTGYIEEDIYDKDMDVDTIVAKLMAMNPQEIAQNEKALIKGFPNTYTFTKNLAEKSLNKKRGDLQCVVFRPAIIASANKEPFPGWTDSLSAAGGVTLLSGLGLINFINITGDNCFDVIAVDIVSNGILVTAANAGTKRIKELQVYNCGTSVANPVTVDKYRKHAMESYKWFSFNNKVFPVHVTYDNNLPKYKLKVKLFNELPMKMMEYVSKIPKIGGEAMRSQVKMLKAIYQRRDETLETMHFFLDGYWNFENQKMVKILELMSPDEREEFDCDCRNMKWDQYTRNYIKGLAIWALKQDQVEPIHDLQQIILKNKFSFSDLKLTMRQKTSFENKSSQIFEQNILNKARFFDFFQNSQGKHIYSEALIKKELQRLRCSIDRINSQASFLYLSNVMSNMVENLNVDTKSIQNIKEMVRDRKTRVVYMPIYKSYGDPLVMHYINYFTDQELGFTFGHYEDSPKIGFVDKILKNIGTFLMRRNPKNSVSNQVKGQALSEDLTYYVNQCLFQEVLAANPITTIYINDERIRSGKINLPKQAESSIKMLLKSFENLEKLKYNIKIVPVCINYDRIFDSKYLASEMVSGEFKDIGTVELMSKIYNKRKGRLGKVFVKYGEPIDLNSFIQNNKDQERLSYILTKHLYQVHQKEQPITMNSLISTAILFNPEQEANFASIKATTGKMYEYIKEKKCKTYISTSPSNYDIQQGCLNLDFTIKGKPMDKKVGYKAIVQFSEKHSLMNSLSMSYYANQIAVNFADESIISHSIQYLINKGKDLTIQNVLQITKTISQVFKDEFLDKEFDEARIVHIISLFEREKIITIENEQIQLLQSFKFSFFKNLLQAIIDSYLIVATTIHELASQKMVMEQTKMVNQLHLATQAIFQRGGIKFMSSCLFEVLNRAFWRFSEMEICKAMTYDNLIFISCPDSIKVEECLDVLGALSSGDTVIIDKQVSRAVFNAQGPLAKL